jgi:uncharacterized protein (DUF2132 family)
MSNLMNRLQPTKREKLFSTDPIGAFWYNYIWYDLNLFRIKIDSFWNWPSVQISVKYLAQAEIIGMYNREVITRVDYL